MRYPVTLWPKPYNGNDPKEQEKYRKQLENAKVIAAYLNQRFDDAPETKKMIVVSYRQIAADLGLRDKDVHDILMPAAGGSNGITVDAPN